MPLTHRIGAVMLSLVVFLSAMSFHLDMHFCGDHLVSLTFADQADSCVMGDMDAHPEPSCGEMIAGVDCCSEAEFYFDGQDQQQKVQKKIDRLAFASLLPQTPYQAPVITRSAEGEAYRAKDPPFLIRELHILYETYLI